MSKVGLPTGLIRYTSQDALEKKPWKFLRARTIIYPVVLAVLTGGFLLAVSTKYSFDARVIRGRGAPFTSQSQGIVTNTFKLRLVNRSSAQQTYLLSIAEPASAEIEVIEPELLTIPEGEDAMIPIQIHFPSKLTIGDGNEKIVLRVQDGSQHDGTVEFRLLGPR